MITELIVLADAPDFGPQARIFFYDHTSRPHTKVSDIASFILGVQQYARKNGRIQTLTVLTHGEFDGPVIGYGHEDVLSCSTVASMHSNLGRMTTAFAPGAEVVFGGCLVGTNPWLLADLSEVWGGIRVTGYTALQQLGMPYRGDKVTLQGRHVVCGPQSSTMEQFQRFPHMPQNHRRNGHH